MFLRSSLSSALLRHCVRSSVQKRTIFTSGSLWSSETPVDSRTLNIKVDTSKRIPVVLEKADGTIRNVEGYLNESVYDLINRIDEERDEFTGYGVCCGTTTCSTCHVILNENDFNKLKPASDEELDLIGYAPENCELSRLSCNIHLTEELKGIKLRFPSSLADNRGEEEMKGNEV